MAGMQDLVHRIRAAGLTAGALLIGMTACAGAPEVPGAAPPAATAQAPSAPPPGAAPMPATGTTSASRIEVLFKLDPRLSGGTYGGEHWVSPATFTSAAQVGTEPSVEVRARALDGRGVPVKAALGWTAADPSFLSVAPVTPGELDHVRITVKRPGQTNLVISAAGVSKELHVTAAPVADGRGMQVDISQ